MDKKVKKRLELLNKKLGPLQQQIKGARLQNDDPGELRRLEEEIASVQAEIAELKKK